MGEPSDLCFNAAVPRPAPTSATVAPAPLGVPKNGLGRWLIADVEAYR
jgi:hypothetical protein